MALAIRKTNLYLTSIALSEQTISLIDGRKP